MKKSAAKKRMTCEERRAQIVRVATGLLVKKGFRGTTTREIAKRAGISEAVIFKHFSRKEDLYRAIISSWCDESTGRSRLIAALEDRKGKDFFRGVASFIMEEHMKDPTLMRLLTVSALEKRELSDVFIRTRGLELLSFLEDRIKSLVKEGLFRKVNANLAARAFLGMVLHYTLAQELYDMKKYFSFSVKEVVDTFVDIFFDGMRRAS